MGLGFLDRIRAAKSRVRAGESFEELDDLNREFEIILQQMQSIAAGGTVGQADRARAIDRMSDYLAELKQLDAEINGRS